MVRSSGSDELQLNPDMRPLSLTLMEKGGFNATTKLTAESVLTPSFLD